MIPSDFVTLTKSLTRYLSEHASHKRATSDPDDRATELNPQVTVTRHLEHTASVGRPDASGGYYATFGAVPEAEGDHVSVVTPVSAP